VTTGATVPASAPLDSLVSATIDTTMTGGSNP